MSRFLEYDTDQFFLLPPSMSEWLPKDHVVHFVRDAVNVLDLSEIYAAYEGGEEGRPAFSPRMLVAVWIYAHMVGIRSSRRLERALRENIGFRILSGNQQPDFWTLNHFRTRHRRLLGDLIIQTVRIARNVGLAPMKQVAVDGTRIQANASKHSAMSYERMIEKERTLEKEIQEYLDACDEADKHDDKKFGKMRSDELPEHLKESAKRLNAIKKAKADLEVEARERARAEQEQRRAQAEKEGRTFRPRSDPEEAKPDPKAQRNFTDPESRIMSKKGKDVIQGYNGQAVVDADTQIVLAADLTNMAADAPHLLPMLEQTQSNAGATPDEMTADAGYFSENNILETEKRMPHTNVLIPPDRQKHGAPKKPVAPAEKTTPVEGATPADSTDNGSPSQEGVTPAAPTHPSETQVTCAEDVTPPLSSDATETDTLSQEGVTPATSAGLIEIQANCAEDVAPPPPTDATETPSQEDATSADPASPSKTAATCPEDVAPPPLTDATETPSREDVAQAQPTDSSQTQAASPDRDASSPPTHPGATQGEANALPDIMNETQEGQGKSNTESPPCDTHADAKSTGESVADRMRRKLSTEDGRQRYKKRRCSVEPVFGQIKGGRGLRQFLHRGTEKARDMWRFECAVHNLLKIFTSGKELVPCPV